jgi:hypothetical protein
MSSSSETPKETPPNTDGQDNVQDNIADPTSNSLNATAKKKKKKTAAKKPRVVEENELHAGMQPYAESEDDEHALYAGDMDPETDSKEYDEGDEEEDEDEDPMGQGSGGFMANFSRILQGRGAAPASSAAQARPSGRFGRMLTVLESTGRVEEKLATLGELSEFLSMATGKLYCIKYVAESCARAHACKLQRTCSMGTEALSWDSSQKHLFGPSCANST